ncbi:MAG: ATP-dependent DNA helicase, partial [Rhodoferax sp.]
MNLPEQVALAFEPDGALARLQPPLTPRAGQQQMALEVARAIADGAVLVAEAGTGVGKTFAYLVPALLSGERILLSTATKALQDQLYNRDIPRLLEVLGVPLRMALLKGRASYLCLHRMALARQDDDAIQPGHVLELAEIERWALHTRSGDLAEVAALEEGSPLLALVTSTRDNCLGASCPQAAQCHVNQARRQAMAADLVVINHHLFFADMQVRESGVAELLPTVSTVVFDEAHQLNDVGVQFLARQWSGAQVQSLLHDLAGMAEQLVLVMQDWRTLVAPLELAVVALHDAAGTLAPGRYAWPGQA